MYFIQTSCNDFRYSVALILVHYCSAIDKLIIKNQIHLWSPAVMWRGNNDQLWALVDRKSTKFEHCSMAVGYHMAVNVLKYYYLYAIRDEQTYYNVLHTLPFLLFYLFIYFC
jgi:hypothetical protein